MGIIIFNGESSEDYHIVVENTPDYDHPEKDYDVTHVPGRNGDIVVDNGSYKNTSRSYDIAFYDRTKPTFVSTAEGVAQWLHAPSGYARLEDTYEPEWYRMAYFVDSGDLTNLLDTAGRATISFKCKPQRFLKSGDIIHTIKTSGTTLRNPMAFTSLPIITVHGSGTGVLSIGDSTISITKITDGMIIDSELQDVYYNTTNLNGVIKFTNGVFPELTPNINTITFSGGITSLEVVPKWWTL